MRQVTLTGTYLEPDGDYADITVRFTPTSTLKNVAENVVLLQETVSARTNGKGQMSVQLYPWQDGMVPNEFLYHVQEYRGSALINAWYLRLDDQTPDQVTMGAVYPASAPVSQEIYPTLTEVRAIAADLDGAVYTEMAELEAQQKGVAEALNTKVSTGELGITVPTMADGKILPQFIPTLSLASSFAATSQAEMTARYDLPLGTICRRTDQGLSYMMEGTDSTNVAAWVQISDNFSVTSVNGKSGMVVLDAIDINAAPYDHQHTHLSGTEYVATLMRGLDVEASRYLRAITGNGKVEVSDQAIRWYDSSGVIIYELNPYATAPWVNTVVKAIRVSDFQPDNNVTTTALVRRDNDNVIGTRITAYNVTVPVYFVYEDPVLSGALLDPLMGTWALLDPQGNPLDSGVLTQRNHQLIPQGYVPSNPLYTLHMEGTISGLYVTGNGVVQVPIDPSDYSAEYSLDIGTVDQALVANAEIVGSYPDQLLNLTMPYGPVGPEGDVGPVGPQGPIGLPGKSVNITSSVASAANLPTSGQTNDGILTTNDGHLHVWDGTKWVDVGDISGPQGLQGPQGVQGVVGPQGAKGDTGDTGSQGIQGLTGQQGPLGPQGQIGPQGIDGGPGPVGPPGSTGAAGPQGVKGDTGATGPAASLPAGGADGQALTKTFVLADTNRATNPSVEVGQDGGWYSNDSTLYWSQASSISPISGSRSVVSTRGNPNLVAAGDNGTFDLNLSGWATAGSPAPSIALSTAQKRSGTNSLLVTWGTAGASATSTFNSITTVVGQQYVVDAWLYIPTGGASSSVIVNGGAFGGNIITVRDQWALSTLTFTATGTTSTVEICHRVASTAGQTCYVDDVKANLLQNLVTQGANGRFEGGNITGFVGSGAAPYAVIAADSSRAHSGTGCMKVTWNTQASAGSQAAYAQVTGMTVGQVYTAECWIYVPGATNLLTSGANGTFEGGDITGWRGVGSPSPTLAADATIKRSGSHSLRATWGTIGSFSSGVQTTTGFPTVIGQQYTAEAWLYIPTGSAQASLYVDSFAGNIVTVKDQWALSTVTFTASATTTYVEVDNRADATAGQLCYIDDVRLFSVASNSVAAAPYTRVEGGSNKSAPQMVTTPDVWTRSSMTFTATLATDYIYFPITGVASTTGQLCYVDDAKVYKALNNVVSSSYFLATASASYFVTPGVPVTFAVDVKVEEPGRRIEGFFSWVGAGSSTSVLVPAGAPGEVVRAVFTATPPAGVVEVYPCISVYAITGNAILGERVWLDNQYMGSDPSGAYYDGSMVSNAKSFRWTGTVNASTSEQLNALAVVTRTNLVTNPNVETNLTGWTSASDTVYALSRDTATPISGTASALCTRQASQPGSTTVNMSFLNGSARIPVTAGQSLTFALDVRAQQAGRRGRLYFMWYAAASGGTETSTTELPVVFQPLTDATTTRISHTATVPAGVTHCVPVINVYTNSGNGVTGEKTWLDNLFLGQGSDGTYFDGSTVVPTTQTYNWTGAAHASTTQRWDLKEGWKTVQGALPAGGTTGQVLAKLSNTDGNANWSTPVPTPPEIPVGGVTGQVLAKATNADRDIAWATPQVNIGERNYATVRRQAAAVSCPNSTQTDMPWDTVDSDNGIPFSAGIFTIPVAGYYNVEAAFGFVANATGYRQIRVLINGATFASTVINATSASSTTSVGFARTFILAAGDTVMVRVQQSSGAALNTDGNPVSNYVSITKVPAPAVNGAASSGIWGTAPLDTATFGTDSLVGREVYVDSAGRLRSRPDRASLDVKDRGAKGDGATDDTAAIQAAINAAAGREVVFPGGTYKTSAALTLKSGVHLRGLGKAQIIGSADHDIINDGGVPVVGGSVRDLYLEVAASSTSGNGVELTGASKVTVRGCEVVAAWDSILIWTGSTDCQVVGNVIRNSRHQGVNVVSSTRVKVQGNLIDTVGTANLHHGVYVSAGSDIDVSGNTIKGACGFAIHVYSATGTPSRFVVANNNCYDNGNGPSGTRGGIYVGGEAQHSDIAITGNVIVDTGGGMGIGATNVKRLTITGNTVRLTGDHGISLESVGGLAIGFTVTGNDVSAYNQNNTGASGLRAAISGTVFGGVVVGNQFREPAGSGPAAIYSSGNANYLIVTNNDMRGGGSLALAGANNVSANNLTP